jgi:hypothetical protein
MAQRNENPMPRNNYISKKQYGSSKSSAGRIFLGQVGIKMIIWHLVRGKMRLVGFCPRKNDFVREKNELVRHRA